MSAQTMICTSSWQFPLETR